ncbi:MAG: Pigment protein, partial [Microbacteriaceae bacterium]|nr:Pigment protein [Microbacteriaceae bacterium]
AFKHMALTKSRAPGGLLATHETVQRDFAQWKNKADSAKAFTYRAFETIYDLVQRGETATPDQEADCRMAATQAAFLAPELTQAVYLMSGSEGLRNSPDNVIQRAFRDAHAASQHALTAQYVYVEAGRIYLDTPGMQETHYRILDHIFAPPLPK